jgi:hypothetical protein
MKMSERQMFSRRSVLRGTAVSLGAAGLGAFEKPANAAKRKKSEAGDQSTATGGCSIVAIIL